MYGNSKDLGELYDIEKELTVLENIQDLTITTTRTTKDEQIDQFVNHKDE